MKNLTAITSLDGGLLLVLVPRYILPACEYEGYARMHCSDTARAEYATGALLIAIGFIMLSIRNRAAVVTSAVGALIIFGVSFWVPAIFGFCLSPKMPCHYGMVPGVRFVSAVGMFITIIALVALTKSYQKKGNS
jgi:amino acid permease